MERSNAVSQSTCRSSRASRLPSGSRNAISSPQVPNFLLPGRKRNRSSCLSPAQESVPESEPEIVRTGLRFVPASGLRKGGGTFRVATSAPLTLSPARNNSPCGRVRLTGSSQKATSLTGNSREGFSFELPPQISQRSAAGEKPYSFQPLCRSDRKSFSV